MAGLNSVDWDTIELPDQPISTTRHYKHEEATLTPRKYAEQLMIFAFGDAYRIINICESHNSTHQLPQGWSFGQLLQGGKQPLLAVAELSDADKRHLLANVEIPEFSRNFLHLFSGTYTGMSPIVTNDDAKGNPRYEWNAEITQWIETNKQPDHGCPALRKIVEDPQGRKQSLIYYFWDKLIESAYPL